jgi:ribosomal protein L11 methyltransferase
MTWHQLSISTDEQTAPMIADFFSNSGAVSVTYMDTHDQPIYEPNLGETKIWQQTTVIGLYELAIKPTLIKQALFSQFNNALLANWQQQLLADQAWERAWMEHYRPMKFANKLWVCPTGQAQLEANTVCMILDPGLAFGTGTHPTTALCLEWLASHQLQDKTIIDYGCGSGILAIAAILLGAKEAYAVDIDPQALIATQANAEKNGVESKIKPYLVDQLPAIHADILLANILAKPLIDLQTTFKRLLKRQGQLILSGLLNEQAQAVSEAYSTQFQVNTAICQQDWCRLDAVKYAN